MRIRLAILASNAFGCFKILTAAAALTMLSATAALAQPTAETAGEANLKLPDLSSVTFLGSIDGHKLLLIGIIFCVLGLAFGLAIYTRLRNLPVHRSMREISELIYGTFKPTLSLRVNSCSSYGSLSPS